MSKYYVYLMEILENDKYQGVYIGQHKIGSKAPSCDGYKGSGCKWKEHILKNKIPVQKTILKMCDDIDESNYWEHYYIEEAKKLGMILWNVVKGGGNHESTRKYTDEEIKEHDKIRFQEWYENNQDHVKEYRKRYYVENKEWLYSQKTAYMEEHKEYYAEYHKKHYQEHKEEYSKRNKLNYEKNKEHNKARMKEYFKTYTETHAEQLRQKANEYNHTHKEERKQYYERLCCYNGETLTLRALILRFRRRNIENPTEVAKQYLIKENEKCFTA